jgi:two-component system, OmpR family, phosphate regulon sensor histidine kinase PhoR
VPLGLKQMKKTFPIITVLITVSLLGIIFFQFLWIKSVADIESQKLRENVTRATAQAGVRLMEEKTITIAPRRPDIIFSTDPFQIDLRKHAVINRFSREEVNSIIKQEFVKLDLPKVKFEFAVTIYSLAGSDQMVSSNHFFDLYNDTSHNVQHNFQLIPSSGSELENMTPQEFLVVIVPNQKQIVFKELLWFIVGAILFTLIIISAFYITLRTLLNQKKIAEIKSDFINNMTHEFKTPLATISLAVDALKNEKVIADKEKSAYFTGVIKEENVRMNKQVEAILQAALLDKQEVQVNLKQHSAHELIENATSNIDLPLKQKAGVLETSFAATKFNVMVDEVHFTNLINNLLDNALKYSKDDTAPLIRLTTANVGNSLRIKIEDNGIGMSKETVHRIFEKFYRAHTGNVHNVKGFGLGLSYVKTMVEAQKGTIRAESILGKGSTFTLQFPLV